MFSSLIINGRISSSKLQRCYYNLCVPFKLLRNGFSSSPPGNNFTLSYLVESLALPPKLAESISKKLNLKDKTKPDSVLSLLRSHGFTDSQISTIVTTYPRLLLIPEAEKTLSSKLKFLHSKEGSSVLEVTEIVSQAPRILTMKGEDKTVSLYYDLVKDILSSDNKFQDLSSSPQFCSSSSSSRQENKIRNVSVLRKLGVSKRFLLPLLISDSQPVCCNEKFELSLKKVVDMGFDPSTAKFVEALRVIYKTSVETYQAKIDNYKSIGLGAGDISYIFKKWPSFISYSEKKIARTLETLRSCCGLTEYEAIAVLKKHPKCICSSETKILTSVEIFVGLGFTRDDFATMVKRYPQCIDYKAETIKKKTEFLVNKMNWPIENLVMIPQVYGYSLEKRILRRCNVIKALVSKGLLVREGCETLPPMSSVLTSTDQAFLRRYVTKHDELVVHELMAIFTADQKARAI
ncbi:unnamed protein product [Cochlearia groenlandica]